ncbi:MAG: ethanolamine ammonia-lyase reactivating factor EutA [Gammaproteobacteria bacterium]|nr:ethanolamine ammonia-lyase reactivating factor EutA [Gammaproteobacteria bacterium]
MPDKPKIDARHTIDDHMFGDFYPHEHDGSADHDHDDIDPGPLEDNPIWQRDNVTLTSVGIDIGSAGTQVIFSNIHLQRVGASLASKYVIVDRITAYESPVEFTPYSDANTIDSTALGKIIDDAYAEAAVLPSDIDTGVVILTGEALRRNNAEAIGALVAEKGGDFVTATAGNHMEAMLAAFGSGAAKHSHAQQCRILNIDIGGGTTKLALVENGSVVWTAALDIGGRLIVVENGKVIRLDPAGLHHAKVAGVSASMGEPISDQQIQDIAESMAEQLCTAISGSEMPPTVEKLFLTEVPNNFKNLDGIMFSGGVGEFVYERENRQFGDLGQDLGKILRQRANEELFGVPVLPAIACIRATALGASEYAVQLSGQTSTITSPGKILPRRNMQVLKPALDFNTTLNADDISIAILHHYTAFDLDPTTDAVALAFAFAGPPQYSRIRTLADGVTNALRGYLDAGHPLYIMLDGDVAQTLGGIFQDELNVKNDLLILDGISLRDFDYIDLGKIRLPSFTVPVTVKSLLFRDDHRGPSRPERIHFRDSVDTTGHQHPHNHAHSHAHSHSQSHSHENKTQNDLDERNNADKI